MIVIIVIFIKMKSFIVDIQKYFWILISLKWIRKPRMNFYICGKVRV